MIDWKALVLRMGTGLWLLSALLAWWHFLWPLQQTLGMVEECGEQIAQCVNPDRHSLVSSPIGMWIGILVSAGLISGLIVWGCDTFDPEWGLWEALGRKFPKKAPREKTDPKPGDWQ